MKNLLLGCGLLIMGLVSYAQTSPVKWTFSAKKKSAGVYDISMTAMVPAPWHIYSQNTPAGGPLPTKISYSTNPLVSIAGVATEDGKSKTIHDQNFGVDVIYFQNDVSFIQTVKLKSPVKTSVRGSVEYMVCNDSKCLPPVTVPFEITLN